MPRVAKPTELPQSFPWKAWEAELKKSPTGALIFDRHDFGDLAPEAFRKRVKTSLRNVQVTVRGEEVLVSRA